MPISKTTLEKYLVQVRRIEKSRIAGAERNIRRIYKSLLKSLNNYLAGEYAKGEITYADLERRIGYARFLEEIANKIDTVAPEVEALIEKTVKETYTSCFDGMREAVRKGNDSLLSVVNPVRVPEAVTRAINNPVSGLTLKLNLQKHRKEIIYNIQQNVGIGIINNDSYTSMAKRIAKVVDGDYHKAVRIARTETHRVKEAALHDCAEEISQEIQKTGNDLVYVKIWRTARDERVRPQRRYKTRAGWRTAKKKSDFDHQKMEGVTVRIDEEFDLGDGFTTKAPGQSGVAGHDINCRCELEYDLLTREEAVEKGLIKRLGSGKIGETDGITTINDIRPVACNNEQEVKKELDDFIEKYSYADVEHALVISTDNKAYELTGIKTKVNPLIIGETQLKDSIIIHNHPVDYDSLLDDSFSKDDLMLLAEYKPSRLYLVSGTRRNAMYYRGDLTRTEMGEAYEKALKVALQRAFEDGTDIGWEQEAVMKVLNEELGGFTFYENF